MEDGTMVFCGAVAATSVPMTYQTEVEMLRDVIK